MRFMVMHYLLIFLLSLSLQTSFAQNFIYPKLAPTGQSIEKLIPNHWHAIDTIYGDLNNDKVDDLVLVFEFNEPIYETRAYGDVSTEIIKEFQRPRMMAIYFKTARQKYMLAHQNNHFILREKEGGNQGDPYRGISIDGNRLNLQFKGGNKWWWQLDYQFKFEHQQWVLVAATNSYRHEDSGSLEEKSYDFVRRKVTETTGSYRERTRNKVTENRLEFDRLRTFSNFKKPWTWEITEDNFL